MPTLPYRIVSCRAVPCRALPCRTVLCRTVPYRTVPYHTAHGASRRIIVHACRIVRCSFSTCNASLIAYFMVSIDASCTHALYGLGCLLVAEHQVPRRRAVEHLLIGRLMDLEGRCIALSSSILPRILSNVSYQTAPHRTTLHHATPRHATIRSAIQRSVRRSRSAL